LEEVAAVHELLRPVDEAGDPRRDTCAGDEDEDRPAEVDLRALPHLQQQVPWAADAVQDDEALQAEDTPPARGLREVAVDGVDHGAEPGTTEVGGGIGAGHRIAESLEDVVNAELGEDGLRDLEDVDGVEVEVGAEGGGLGPPLMKHRDLFLGRVDEREERGAGLAADVLVPPADPLDGLTDRPAPVVIRHAVISQSAGVWRTT